jgi:hypothetical protein
MALLPVLGVFLGLAVNASDAQVRRAFDCIVIRLRCDCRAFLLRL